MKRYEQAKLAPYTTKGELIKLCFNEEEAAHMDCALPQNWLDVTAENAKGDIIENYEALRFGAVWNCEQWRPEFLTLEAYNVNKSAQEATA